MRPARAFRPSVIDSLETRVVLSHLTITHKPVGHPAARAGQSSNSLPSGLGFDGTIQTKYSDGRVETAEDAATFTGPHSFRFSTIIRRGNQLLEVDQEDGTIANNVVDFKTDIDKSSVGHQTETGTDTLAHSFGSIRPDGTVAAGVGLLTTTTIDHVLSQVGLGTQTTVGTEVAGSNSGQQISVTNEVVTNFDGTQDRVHILTRATGDGPTVTTTTTTHADGTTTTLVATARVTSALTV